MSDNIFTGCIPALMTPCTPQRTPDFDALVEDLSKAFDAHQVNGSARNDLLQILGGMKGEIVTK